MFFHKIMSIVDVKKGDMFHQFLYKFSDFVSQGKNKQKWQIIQNPNKMLLLCPKKS